MRIGCAKMEAAYPGMECELPSLSTLSTGDGDGEDGIYRLFFNSISQRREEHEPVFFKFFNLV